MPDPATLVQEIEAHQRSLDELRENYTFHEIIKTDELDGNGSVKDSTTPRNATSSSSTAIASRAC